MDIYQTEEEQVEALKKWWAENGKSAIFGVVLGLGAIFGWREWQDYESIRATAASELYQEMVVAARTDDAVKLEERALDIVSEYDNTAYGVFARLALARVAVEKGELETAATQLRAALEETSNTHIEHVIRLRLGRVLTNAGKTTEAAKLLAGVKKRGEFEVSYLELEADIQRRDKKLSEAHDTYQEAIAVASSKDLDTSLLELKRDDLGSH